MILELYLLVPEVQKLSTTIIIAIVAYGIANVIIVFSRISGTKAMKKCFPGMLPAQESLLVSNNYIDSYTKQRYYAFLTKHIEGFNVSEDDKEMKLMAATAVTWLIAQTRDSSKFPLIAEENINFGFSYNLLGLKPYGIIIAMIGLITNAILFLLNYKEIITIQQQSVLAGFMIDLLFLLLWIFIVTKPLVNDCGKKYARALLSACDSPHLN